ncbi:fusaric acid resistance protein-like domain containing protein [Phanerochaete sordida]|uniref:Fusaric acid resistance protein-like domain containing protein n=1 Tax=Phanerochaete sordida TaxID=48140 RepID=A0A9P3LEL6_9APHY|nr:fusaric acid resistance protein-like domain containing protein [Phanerochaete sordida]
MSAPPPPAHEKGSPQLNGEKAAGRTSDSVRQPSLSAPEPAATSKQPLLDRLHLPAWVVTNLRSPRSRKVWLRCWVASFAAYVILLPNASLRELGNAAFFTILASFMVPANLPVQLFLFVLTTMVVGLCMGWAFGAAAMRAALAARNQEVLKASLQREAQSAAGLANPEALFQADIFAGKFLDTASSFVFAVFLGFGCFVFALIRSYAPKLMLLSIFGTIATDIFCSYGALFPFGQYTLLNSLLESIACYCAIAIVCIVFIFPETLNHATLVSTSALVGNLKNIIDLQHQILNASPEALAEGTPLAAKMQGLRVGVFMQIQQMIGSLKFIGAEFSWGKWNADDVKGLKEPLILLVNRAAAFHTFAKLAGHPISRGADHDLSREGSASSDTPASSITDAHGFTGDTPLLRQLRHKHSAAESAHAVRMHDLLPVIEDATAELRAACAAGLAATQAVLDSINTRRYARQGDRESGARLAALDAALEQLRGALAAFQDVRRRALLAPFGGVLADARAAPPAALRPGALPLRSLYVSFVFAANLVVCADAVRGLMEYVQLTAHARRRNRLWAPGGLRALARALVARGDTSDQAAGEDHAPQPDAEVKEEELPYRRDPDSRPPTNALQRLANRLHGLYKWTKTPEALFCFRYVLVSIALYIPAVVRTSAHFIYVNKGLWSLIMAQTTLNIFVSDQIFNYFTRLLGTFIGAVLGLLSWYIGDAKSNGSAYGSGATMAVFLVPLVFVRLFSPPQYLAGVLLGCATFALVQGYSWIDGHLHLVGNPGIGWDVAWRRFVNVIIGSAASFVLMMLPPKSGRKAVRLRNASTMSQLAFLYSDIMAAWISSGSARHAHGALAELLPDARRKFLALAAQLQAVKTQTAIARWEGSVRGAWPGDEYMRLASVQTDMMSSLALLASALAQIDPAMRVGFLQRTMAVNPNFIADVMATFSLVSQALRTGEPLPQAFHQNLLDRLHYHGTVGRHTYTTADGGANDATHRNHLDAIDQYEFMFYATAICAVFQIVEGLDELRSITTRLCGEIPLQGWTKWKAEYDESHVMNP